MHRSYLVFSGTPDPSEDVFFGDIIENIEALVLLGLHFEFESEETLIEGSLRMFWIECDELALITIVKTKETKICYALIETIRRKDLKAITAFFRQRMSIELVENLQDKAQKSLFRDPLLLLRLGIASASLSLDRATLNLIKKGLDHRFPHIRRSAAMAAAWATWPELIPALEEILKGDENKEVQIEAHQALTLCLERQERERLRA